MERFVSEPIRLAEAHDAEVAFSRADLVFYGVDHSGESYEGRVFLDNPDAGLETPREADAGYAGSFFVFGHGGCYGDEGHCDTQLRTTDEFDLRPPHPLEPFTKTVIVTEALRRATGRAVVVTVVPVVAERGGPRLSEALRFTHVRVLTYL
jgi:tyrosinase